MDVPGTQESGRGSVSRLLAVLLLGRILYCSVGGMLVLLL